MFPSELERSRGNAAAEGAWVGLEREAEARAAAAAYYLQQEVNGRHTQRYDYPPETFNEARMYMRA